MEDNDPINLYNVKGRFRSSSCFTPISRLSLQKPTQTVLPHLSSCSISHPLAHTSQEHDSGNPNVLACQPQRESPSKEMLDLEREERLALARLNQELFLSTYKKDYQENKWKLSSEYPDRPTTTTKPLPFTSTAHSYQPPKVVPSLTNNPTRFGSRARARQVKAADGIVPGSYSDMYRDPLYTTPCYITQFTDPQQQTQ